MITHNKVIELIHKLLMLAVMVGLLSAGGFSIVPKASADNNSVERGEIVIGRHLSKRSAIRPNSSGTYRTVDAKPNMSSLKQLSEDEFASITTDRPLIQVGVNQFVNNSTQGISGHTGRANINTGLIRSTEGINRVIRGSGVSGASISRSVNRATSSISGTISGAMGLK